MYGEFSSPQFQLPFDDRGVVASMALYLKVRQARGWIKIPTSDFKHLKRFEAVIVVTSNASTGERLSGGLLWSRCR